MQSKSVPHEGENKIITIPNFLSLFRIFLLPVIVWFYVVKGRYSIAGSVLILSGITDIVDGFIARRFHMVSNLGKILDPIADKLTQAIVLICLMTRFPWMLLPLVLMACKELCMAVTGSLVIRKTGQVPGAVWHGKIATILLYAMLLLHIFLPNISSMWSIGSIVICTGMIGLSFSLYMNRNYKLLNQERKFKD